MVLCFTYTSIKKKSFTYANFFVGFPVASSSSSFGRNFRWLRLRIASGPFEWTKAADRSLRKIKEKLTEAHMPALTNFNLFRWTCDASHIGIGATLSRDYRPMVFYWDKLNGAQTRYSHDIEFYVVIQLSRVGATI